MPNNPKFYGKKPIIGIYDAKNWKLISNIKKGYGPEQEVKFTPDGQFLIDIARLGEDIERKWSVPPVIRFWSVPDLKLVRAIDKFFTGDSIIFDMGLSHDGKTLGVAASHPVEGLKGRLFIDLETQELRHDYQGEGGLHMQFSANDRYVLMGQDKERYLISILDTHKDFELVERVTLAETSSGESTAFSPDGTKAALFSVDTVYIWDIKE